MERIGEKFGDDSRVGAFGDQEMTGHPHTDDVDAHPTSHLDGDDR